MIIIEFAVNDEYDSISLESIEGLVRQCLLFDDKVPVLLFFTFNIEGLNIQHLQKSVGFHYQLPMISYRDALWPLIEKGAILWDLISADVVHPNDTGHRLCAYFLYHFIQQTYIIKEANNDSNIAMPLFLFSDTYESADIYSSRDSILDITVKTGWVPINNKRNRIGFSTNQSGSILEMRSFCREVTLGVISGEQLNSKIQIKVDGVIHDTISNFSKAIPNTAYVKFTRLFSYPKKSSHFIEINALDNDLFCIEYILYAGL
jgi:hypothetical protein